MAIINPLIPPPFNTPINDQSDRLSKGWIRWFQDLWILNKETYRSLDSTDITSDDTIEFILTDSTAGRFEYKISLDNVLVSQPDTIMYLRMSTDAGSTYINGVTSYSWRVVNMGDTVTTTTDTEDNQIQLNTAEFKNATTNLISGEILVKHLDTSTTTKSVAWNLRYKDENDVLVIVAGAGQLNSNTDVDAIKLYLSNGVFTSGNVTITGAK